METTEMITCRDCGTPFEFTPGEQRFYESKGWPKPIRCEACRVAKKRRYAEAAKYAGIREVMRNSSCKKRDTKGTFLNRSGWPWDVVDYMYMPYNDTLEYDEPTDPELVLYRDYDGNPVFDSWRFYV